MSTILINSLRLNPKQAVKLWSNPVSGIACGYDGNYALQHGMKFHLERIRYSKSMLLGALNFWFDKYHAYSMKMWHMRTSYISFFDNMLGILQELGDIMESVRNMPDTFLFSHRHIEEMDVNLYRKYSGRTLAATNHQLNKKYEDIKGIGFRAQTRTMDPFCRMESRSTGISFTIFPNEKMYITKQKITNVGITDKGNVYIMHGKRK